MVSNLQKHFQSVCWENSEYKWTCEVHMSVVQGSTIPFQSTIVLYSFKNTECIEANLTKDVQDLYSVNWKSSRKMYSVKSQKARYKKVSYLRMDLCIKKKKCPSNSQQSLSGRKCHTGFYKLDGKTSCIIKTTLKNNEFGEMTWPVFKHLPSRQCVTINNVDT